MGRGYEYGEGKSGRLTRMLQLLEQSWSAVNVKQLYCVDVTDITPALDQTNIMEEEWDNDMTIMMVVKPQPFLRVRVGDFM